MSRRRALIAIVIAAGSVIACVVGGAIWLVGVAVMGVAYVVLVASL